jgi:hypothetical protein
MPIAKVIIWDTTARTFPFQGISVGGFQFQKDTSRKFQNENFLLSAFYEADNQDYSQSVKL